MQLKPSLKQFEFFLSVAEHQGFTRAAKSLGISKTSLSNTIKKLESELGVDLFIRTTRRVELTEEGILLMQQCLKLRSELDITRELVTSFHQQPKGKLTIFGNPFLAEKQLLPHITHYQQMFPDVNIDLLLDERMPDMNSEMVDIVFGVNWPAPHDIVARPYANTRYVLCATPEYLLQHGEPKTIKQLAEHKLIAHLGRKHPRDLCELKQQTQPDMNVCLAINNAGYIKTCVLNGNGIGQFHDYMVEQELKNGLLVELLSNNFHQTIPLYVYYQKHRFIQPKIRQFINMIFA